MQLNAFIDHTLLKPTTTLKEVERLVEEGHQYGFAAVCIPPVYVAAARRLAGESALKICTVIGFPFGYSTLEAKLIETECAIRDGAEELDFVINLTALRNGDWPGLKNEINRWLPLVRDHQKISKVIIESGILLESEIVRCCELYGEAGVDFVKTSTGYAEKGATLEAVRLMKRHLPPLVGIKASGGIRDRATAEAFINEGAGRLGTSASVQLVL